jgi:hypothetical protein
VFEDVIFDAGKAQRARRIEALALNSRATSSIAAMPPSRMRARRTCDREGRAFAPQPEPDGIGQIVDVEAPVAEA